MVSEAKQRVIDAIREELPAYFPISENRLLDKKTIYNLMSRGEGPETVNIGGKEYLERESYLCWALGRGRNAKKRGRRRATA